ncbi:uncharacterized protein LOC144716773 [Wolffia australiana]
MTILHAALEKREVVDLMASQIMSVTDKDIRISREEWDMLADFCNILGPFYQKTKYVSGSKTVRVMEVIGIMKALLRHVDTILSKFDMATIFSSARRMTAAQIASICRASAILDPFNKGASLESNDLQESLAFVRQLMPQHSQHELMYNDPEDEDWLAELIDGVPPARGKERRVPVPAKELEAYLQSTERKDNETALGWWARFGARSYPRLATLAQEFLSVCATIAPAERLFSAGRAVVTFKRTRLSAESIELLVTVKCWLRAENSLLCDGDRGEDSPDDDA